jgi:homoserine kinase type II
MKRARNDGLAFVPAVFFTLDGASWVEADGRLWEVTQWMPGQADFQEKPTATRLEEACTALARLHECWRQTTETRTDVCPAISRRIERTREMLALSRSGWQPAIRLDDADPARPVAERAWRILPARVEAMPSRLERWVARRWPLQPCLCDVWHDHVLFEGDRLSGLIDYGAIKVDHVAVDLARLLGSLVEDDVERWNVGLRAYRTVRGLSADEEELVRVLDETGTVLGVANWLRWLYKGERQFEDRRTGAERLRIFVERVERWR